MYNARTGNRGGTMELREWLKRERISGAELARRIGVSRKAVWYYVHGLRVPRPAVIERIVRETRGEVTPADLLFVGRRDDGA